jgi:predicted Zn-dependent peptidase
MADVGVTELENGLPLFRIGIQGTRAVTVAVAFPAGSRAERPDENGIAHFLEHLVFKGGQDYPTHRDINTTAEGMGARMNAYTASDHVVFWMVARADRLHQAADLLTDFTARPRIDPAELEKERDVVIQEIARTHDQPSMLVDDLLAQATFPDHPLGRPILGTPERLHTHDRDKALAFRERSWAGPAGGAFLVGNPEALAADGSLDELFERFPAVDPQPVEPAPDSPGTRIVEHRDSKQSHLRLGYRVPIDTADPAQRAAFSVYATLLGGSAASRLFEEIREQRGLAYSVSANDYPVADAAILEVSAGLESARCVEAYRRMREIVAELATEGPAEDEVERAREFTAGRRVITFESTTAVARAMISERVVFGGSVDPDELIARLDAVTHDDVAAVAKAVDGEPAIACLGPHSPEEFD